MTYQDRKAFADKFNRLVGTKMGAPLQTPVEDITTNETGNRNAALLRYSKPKAAPKRVGSALKKSSTTEISEEEKNAFLEARSNEMNAEPDLPWWKDALKVASRPLDILNRPAAAVVNSGNSMLEAVKEGEPIWSLGDDIGYGAWRGLSGQDKRGGGDFLNNVLDLSKNPSQEGGSKGTRTVSKNGESDWQPIVGKVENKILGASPTQWAKRAGGLGIDLATDPTTYLGVGAVTRALGVGEQAAKAAGKEAVLEAAKGSIDNVFLDALDEPVDLVARKTTANKGRNALIRKAEDLKLNRLQTENKAIKGVQGGKITPDDFIKSQTSAAARKVIAEGTRAKSTTDQIVDTIIKMQKNEIDTTTKTARQMMKEQIEDVVNPIVHEVQGGALAGKIVGDTSENLSRTVGQHIAESAKAKIVEPLNVTVDRFKSTIGSKKGMTVDEIRNATNNTPYFDVWHNALKEELKNVKKVPTPAQLTRAYKAADDAVAESLVKMGNDIMAVTQSAIEDAVTKVPTLRFMGQNVKEFPKLGEYLKGNSDKLAKTRVGKTFNDAFRYSSHMTEYSSLIAQKGRALGIKRFEEFYGRTAKVAKQYNRAQRKELHVLLEIGNPPIDPHMLEGYNFLKKQYDEVAGQELASGMRDMHERAGNYAYTHAKRAKGTVSIDKVMRERKDAIKAGGYKNVAGYTSTELKNKGLIVEEDAFKNLLYRKMKSEREMTKSFFYKDLVQHYGIKSKYMTKAEMEARGLVEATAKDKYSGALKDLPLAEGEKIYIDKGVNDIWNYYGKLSNLKVGPEAAEVVRQFDWLTRKFKTWNTVYFPAYHVRNMVGDVFMGILDGVKTTDYATVGRHWFNKDLGEITVAGEKVKFSKMWNDYKENLGSGGFFSTDIPEKNLIGGHHPAQVVRDLSESREDFGRFVHFYHAMNEEYKGFLKKGYDKDRAWKEAIDTSSERLNKFKFDYGALTVFEQKYVKRGIPFYTYMRKAAPTLIESALLKPRYLGNINRMQQNLEDDWQDQMLPSWLRELGFMKLPFGDGDYGMTADLLPTATLNKITDNPVISANPLIQIPFELNSGKDTFTGKPVNGIGEVLQGKWRGVASWNTLNNDDKTTVEKVMHFVGLPVRRVDSKETDQAYQEIRYNLGKKIDNISAKVEAKGYSVYMSDRKSGISLRVKDKTTGEVVFEGNSIKEVEGFVNGL